MPKRGKRGGTCEKWTRLNYHLNAVRSCGCCSFFFGFSLFMTGRGQLLAWICTSIRSKTDCFAPHSVSRPTAKIKTVTQHTMHLSKKLKHWPFTGTDAPSPATMAPIHGVSKYLEGSVKIVHILHAVTSEILKGGGLTHVEKHHAVLNDVHLQRHSG